MLAATLPYHNLQAEATWTLVVQVFLAPATWIALAVIALGFGAWFARSRFSSLAQALKPFLTKGFGLEDLPRLIAGWTEGIAASLQKIHTGQLNWNVVGIPVGLIMILIILMRYK